MINESYGFGFQDELEKIAASKSLIKRVGKFVSDKPTTTGAIMGALAGTIPSDHPLVVSPYTLSEGFHETKGRAERRRRSYIQKLPERVLAGALTGAFLGKLTSNISKEFKPQIKK